MILEELLNDINLFIILCTIAFIIIILTVLAVIMLVKYVKLKKRYDIFMSGFYEDRNFEEMLDMMTGQIEFQEKKSIDISKRLSVLENNVQFALQKTGIVRYKAFENKGGDQSFSIALLDRKNNGFVITSIYNDGVSSVYGKEIKEGESVHRLSDEEKTALDKARRYFEENLQ